MTEYSCFYKDGTIIHGLTFEESLARFKDSFDTENSCSVAPEPKPYVAPGRQKS